MLLFILCVVLAVICIIIAVKCDEIDWLSFQSTMMTIVSVLLTLTAVAMGIIILCSNMNTNGKLAGYNAEREATVYQIENKTYLNDNNVGAYEVFTDVSTWNAHIALAQTARKNPWLNWFYGAHWDQLKPIDLN